MKHASEFLLRDITLSENIVVLEELEKSKTVFLNHVLNFLHECHMCSLAVEIDVFFNIGGLGTSSWSIDDIFQAVGVLKELCIHNLVVLVAIDRSN